MSIPIVVVLWENPGFNGHKRTLVTNVDDLTITRFNDTTRSIAIHPGPDYQPSSVVTVSFFEDHLFQGRELCVGQGLYSDLGIFSMGGISSVRLNGDVVRTPGLYDHGKPLLSFGPAPAAAQIAPIPLIVDFFTEALVINPYTQQPAPYQFENPNQRWISVVQDVDDIGATFGGDFVNSISAAAIRQGSPVVEGDAVLLWRGRNHTGGALLPTLGVGVYPDFSQLQWNDVTAGIEFVDPISVQQSIQVVTPTAAYLADAVQRRNDWAKLAVERVR